MTGALIALAVLLAATAFGLLRRRRDGTLRARKGTEVATEMERLDVTEVGAEPGGRATLVQFSSAFCAPCRATRRILGEVAATVEGVRHVEIDAEAHLDLVRRLNIVRTPTVLVLDGTGRIVRRGSGLPRKPDVIAALGDVIPA